MGSSISVMIWGLLLFYYGTFEESLVWVRIAGLIFHFVGVFLVTSAYDELKDRVKILENLVRERKES
jgi:drug/metabolite transporter (DMT)-like permease